MNDMFNADNALQVIACIVASYLIGSFPTAYFVGKARNVNIFEVGSGNMGGTNVARAVGKGWAIFTGLVDVSKGVFAVWLARDVILPEQIGVATSISATSVVVGHNWSLFATVLTASIKEGKLRLIVRGGKGAATAFGAMMMIQPFQSLVAAAIGIAIISRTRYVSLGVLIGFAVANVWLILLIGTEFQKPILLVYAVALSAMLLLRHRGNVQRLLAGTERRLGEQVSS
ncbi:MAG: glycerol-3-phosphate acyltransferase [Chloroflexota bacterium]|nr:glycerol-3-phosphate acyltransferase [Chloroflexota bacterium]MDE2858160.1 glycerol-3-phosphate acyltransferase [Chloroflexota bacterium]MDE2951565.1 glycerol-3-phosphate acyltransferase [Chloroflexota bacterium]